MFSLLYDVRNNPSSLDAKGKVGKTTKSASLSNLGNSPKRTIEIVDATNVIRAVAHTSNIICIAQYTYKYNAINGQKGQLTTGINIPIRLPSPSGELVRFKGRKQGTKAMTNICGS
jgi:hypothetical protein